jgi:hypothetical protein
MSSEAPCDICGGVLDITATIIGCRNCGAIWGRCNGVWVEGRGEHVDPPPSPESVSGLYADCTPPVSAEGMFCPDCDGVGRIPERREDVFCDPERECAFCHGTGRVLRDHK